MQEINFINIFIFKVVQKYYSFLFEVLRTGVATSIKNDNTIL